MRQEAVVYVLSRSQIMYYLMVAGDVWAAQTRGNAPRPLATIGSHSSSGARGKNTVVPRLATLI